MEADVNQRALDGVRVLDLTHTLAGPLCTRILADLGAEVVKVEPPTGDQVRPFPPVISGASAFFHHMNAGKRSLVADVRRTDGAEIVARLAGEADVLVENWRPGALARRGLGASDLLGRNPRLVYCSITGWGQTGPWVDRRAYAPLVHAEVGTLEVAARVRGEAPRGEVHQQADVHGGLSAVTAILAGLLLRDRTGVGQHLDCTLAESHLFVSDQVSLDLAGYDGMQMMDTWNFPVLRVGSGEYACLISNPIRGFPLWVQVLGGEPVDSDPRFATMEARAARVPEMIEVLAELCRRIPTYTELEARCEGQPVFVSPVRSTLELGRTDWAGHRRLFAEAADGVDVPTAFFRASGMETGLCGPSPELAEHTGDVLRRWLGLADAEIDRLVESHAIAT